MVSSKLIPIHSAAANKEELLEMITHGADKIINATSDEYVFLSFGNTLLS